VPGYLHRLSIEASDDASFVSFRGTVEKVVSISGLNSTLTSLATVLPTFSMRWSGSAWTTSVSLVLFGLWYGLALKRKVDEAIEFSLVGWLPALGMSSKRECRAAMST
jgi:hypothetical protein